MSQSGLQDLVVRLRRGATREGVAEFACGELLERFVGQRDELAFEELVYRHGPKVYAVCRRFLRDRQLAEDAFQATFIVLARKAPTIRPRSAVGGFLYGVARRCALEAFSMSRRRNETLVSSLPETAQLTDRGVDPDVLEMLDAEIANLSEAYRAAVVLCELDGVGRSEAAKRLGIAEGTLSSRLAAARKQLASRLAKRGVVFSAGLMSTLADSLRAGVPTGLTVHAAQIATGVLSPTATILADGVIRTMLMSKLKLAGFLIAMTTLLGLGVLLPGGTTETTAAPVPKAKPDEGLLWLLDEEKRELMCYTPEGKLEKSVKLDVGERFLGLTPDRTKFLSARKGKSADARPEKKGRLTLHLVGVENGQDVEDLGIEWSPTDQFIWSPDGTGFIRQWGSQPWHVGEEIKLKHWLFDLKTKKETPLDLLSNHELMKWSPDGKTWWVRKPLGDESLTPWSRLPVTGGKGIVLDGSTGFQRLETTPDGKTHFAVSVSGKTDDNERGYHCLNAVDDQTGKVRVLRQFDGLGELALHLSPDARRVALLARSGDYVGEKKTWSNATLSVVDPDGRNAKTILTFRGGPRISFLGWFPSKPAPRAPVPKAKDPKDNGLIWLFNRGSSELTAYTPDGKVDEKLKLKDGKHFLYFTPDGTKILFAGKKGKLADQDEKEGVTLHVRGINAETEGKDLGIGYQANDGFVWSPDGKQVVRTRVKKVRTIDQGGHIFGNTLIDLETKKETELDFPTDHQVLRWSRDGKTWWVLENTNGKDPKLPPYRWHLFPVKGGKGKPYNDGYSLLGCGALSPDGKTEMATGYKHPLGQPIEYQWFNIDTASGEVIPVKKFDKVAFVIPHWSPKGGQVAYMSYAFDKEKKPDPRDTTLYLAEPDGRNTKLLVEFANDGQQTVMLGWFPRQPEAKMDEPKPHEEKPKEPNDEGCVWLYDQQTSLLEAYRPDGKKLKGWKLDCGPRFRGVSPDGARILFGAEAGGKPAKKPFDDVALKLHLRELGEGGKVTELDIGDQLADRIFWRPDGERFARFRHSPPAGGRGVGTLTIFEGRGKQIDEHMVPDDSIPVAWQPDGESFLFRNADQQVGRFSPGHFLFFWIDAREGGWLKGVECSNVEKPRLSPDGKTILAFRKGERDAKLQVGKQPMALFDIKAMEFREIARLSPSEIWIDSRWSPDGKRILYCWGEAESSAWYQQPEAKCHVVACDRDGKNAKTMLTVTKEPDRCKLVGWTPTPALLK